MEKKIKFTKFMESLPPHLTVYGQGDSYLHDTPSVGIASAAYLENGRGIVVTSERANVESKGKEKNWDQEVLDFEKKNRRDGSLEWKGLIKIMIVLHAPQWSKTVRMDTLTFSRVVEDIYSHVPV